MPLAQVLCKATTGVPVRPFSTTHAQSLRVPALSHLTPVTGSEVSSLLCSRMSWSPERQVKAGAFVPFLPTPEAQEELEPGAVQKFVEALFQFRPHIQVDSPRCARRNVNGPLQGGLSGGLPVLVLSGHPKGSTSA